MRTIVTLLAISFVVVGVPVVAADETAPDCEANQPVIGYANTLLVTQLLNNNGRPVFVCEGEQWDGQDTVQPDQTGACPGPTTNLNPNALFVGVCSGSDPNTAPDLDPTNPLSLRVSSANGNSVYTGTNIAAVGRAAVYVGSDESAVYLRDNTPGNQLATVISMARITQGYPAESDCSQAVYQQGAFEPPSKCGRDNTAITLEYNALP